MNATFHSRSLRLSILAVMLLGGAPDLRAQLPPPAPPAPRDAQTAGQPPAVTFSPGGITLEEALRLALQWDPQMLLQRSNVRFREGVLQEQGGLFDTTFRASTTYDFRRQELAESRKEFERQKRDDIRTGLNDNAARISLARRLLTAVQNVRNAPPGSTAQVNELTNIDEEIGTQVRIIDALIAEVGNPQARADLEASRQTFLDRTLSSLQNGLGTALENEATARDKLEKLGAVPVDEVFYSGRVRLGLSKIFRSGISVSPFLESSMEGTNFVDKPRDADFGGKGLEDLYTFRLGTNITFPLMRGRSGDSIAAGERAARVERDISELTARHQLSITARQTAFAYWDLRAAQQAADIAAASLEKQAEIVKLTNDLVEAQELPEAELARTEAAEARARARVRDSERRLVEARVALASVMGVATASEAALPRASDPFPAAPAAGAVQAAVATDVDPGDRRPDIIAAAQREEVSRIFERRAIVDLRPRLDLTGGFWYTALDEQTIQRAVDRWVGPSTNLTLDLERPFGNNQSRGRVAQSQADVEQSRITTADLRRQTQLQLVRLVASIEEAAERVRLAEATVAAYDRVIAADLERFRIRDITLIDTLLTEAQQTDARLTVVNAQRDLARLIAELRFETGTLLQGDTVAADGLTTIPVIRR